MTDASIRRRSFITLLGGAAVAWPVAARAQQPAIMPRIGIIDYTPMWEPFRQRLRDLGYVDNSNVVFELRTAESKVEALAAAAADMVRLPVDLIATFGTPQAVAAKRATTTIPVVMIAVGDPVGAGLVASFPRPGGNVTGNTVLGPEIGAKRLQLLKEVFPSISRVAFLWNPDNASNTLYFEELKTVAPILGVTLISVEMRSFDVFSNAFANMMRGRPDGSMMSGDALLQLHIDSIFEFMAKNRLPGMYQYRENVVAGGLMSYGASLPDLFRRGAGYAHRILQGTKPADLPVEAPVTFELVVNLKTAKAIGLTIPETFLVRADEVIE